MRCVKVKGPVDPGEAVVATPTVGLLPTNHRLAGLPTALGGPRRLLRSLPLPWSALPVDPIVGGVNGGRRDNTIGGGTPELETGNRPAAGVTCRGLDWDAVLLHVNNRPPGVVVLCTFGDDPGDVKGDANGDVRTGRGGDKASVCSKALMRDNSCARSAVCTESKPGSALNLT